MKESGVEEELNQHYEQQLEEQILVLIYDRGSGVHNAYYTDDWSRIKALTMATQRIDTRNN